MIGSSNDLNAIWNRIRTQLRFGNFMIDDLQMTENIGEENFKYEILSELKHDNPDKTDYSKDIKALEELYLEWELQPYDERGYNRRKK
ncbi:MAG: hypothetical protein R2759_09850 [Bacteroidales bacterium]